MKEILFLGLSFALLTACVKDEDPAPKALFTASTTSAIIGEEISFTNQSKNSELFRWEFRDNTDFEYETDATHTFLRSGVFEVKLTASNKNSDFNVYTIPITIAAKKTITTSVGVESYKIGSTWEEFLYAAETQNDKIDTLAYSISALNPTGKIFLSKYEIKEKGLSFFFFTSEQNKPNNTLDSLYQINITDPYSGETEDGISLGDLPDEIYAAYSQPDSIILNKGYKEILSNTKLLYLDLGMGFYYESYINGIEKMYLFKNGYFINQ